MLYFNNLWSRVIEMPFRVEKVIPLVPRREVVEIIPLVPVRKVALI